MLTFTILLKTRTLINDRHIAHHSNRLPTQDTANNALKITDSNT